MRPMAGSSRRAGWIAVLSLGRLLACSEAEAQSLVDVIRQALAQYQTEPPTWSAQEEQVSAS